MNAVPEKFPFTLTDELFYHLEEPSSPFSIQMEVRLEGHLDPARLEQAIIAAAHRHPMMRVVMAPWEPNDQQYLWELFPRLDVAPLRVVDCPDEEALYRTRAELHSLSVPLSEVPPFRMVLARYGDDDYLMLNLSHAVCDGIGEYRFLCSVLRQYADVDDPPAAVDFMTVRELERQLGARGVRERLNRAARLLEILGNAIKPPARIAPEGSEADEGVSFVPLRFNRADTAGLQKLRLHDATVNDVLMTVTHLAIQRWNREHDRETGRISVMMPMSTRAPEYRFDIAGNLSLWVNIASRTDDRADFETLLKHVRRQTSQLKDRGTAGLLIDLLNDIRNLPLWIKQALPNLLPLTGNRIVDTTVLNNLGRLPDPLPEDTGLRIREWWFSPPCRLPMGLSIGAATFHEHLHLSFRYSRSRFSREGAWSFAETWLDELQSAWKTTAG